MIFTLISFKALVFYRIKLIDMLNTCLTAIDFDVYQPRNPNASAYYRCVEDHFEQLETVWDERYANRYGFWRPYMIDADYPIETYLKKILPQVSR